MIAVAECIRSSESLVGRTHCALEEVLCWKVRVAERERRRKKYGI